MTQSGDKAKKRLIDQASAMIKKRASKSQAKLAEEFTRRFYNLVALHDLELLGPENIAGMLLSQWSTFSTRSRGETKIRVFNPSVEVDGWHSRHSIVQLCCDDMPFLVDSVRMEINRSGCLVHLVVHVGGLNVVRNDKGAVKQIVPLDGYDEEARPDAIIHLEIDRQTDTEVMKGLADGLQRVLQDVQKAVDDWLPMRKRLQEALMELEQRYLPLDSAELAESKDFLRWLDSDHFTFLGSRDYETYGEGDKKALRLVSGSGLGVLSDETHSKQVRMYSEMPEEARRQALSKQILIIAKTNTESSVHRPAYTDFISVKCFNERGEITGEKRFVGLYTSVAYNTNPKHIPFLRHKVAQVMQMSHLSPNGHAGKALLHILETLPRDDLFQASPEELLELSVGILQLQERQQIRLFIRKDSYGRFYSCLVYVPRDKFNTELRQKFQTILAETFSSHRTSFSTLFSDSMLARIHFNIRVDPTDHVEYDVREIEAKLVKAARYWVDDLRSSLIDAYGDNSGAEYFSKYSAAFPVAYQEFYQPDEAVRDIAHLELLADEHEIEMDLRASASEDGTILHFKLFNRYGTAPLSDVLPLLEKMGLRVLGERPYRIRMKEGQNVWINDFDMKCVNETTYSIEEISCNFKEAFSSIWEGACEDDDFNRLIILANLNWRDISVLRALAKYLRQVGFTFSQDYIEDALAKHPSIVRQLTDLFDQRFNPKRNPTEDALNEIRLDIEAQLDDVSNLDEDRILRRYLDLIFAILRTNHYQKVDDSDFKGYLSLKFNPDLIPDLPLPRPMFEIFVYSPRVEGVHLRASSVARGGLRWSDRREDFRTEILGLMKAQQVKNAVIVPSGAKGGFYPKNLPEGGSREEVMSEVVSCYRTFISGLLDLTDNIVSGQVIHPENTKRYDDEDSYLVVAADKGTATFSDIANSIAEEYNYWLSDAFASGGSEGYDHKKMGITARGAWVSVMRNFMELGVNTQEDDFTVVGIGDMSGDVFGNGMLLSPHIKLVLAFNHMHIFVDPDPDARTSFKERRRLFNLPRSSWADYDESLMSKGGGIFSRTAKFIKITAAMKKLFDIDADKLEPNELIRAALRSQVDLIWNGGIGTFVKSVSESHADVGDRHSEAIRVNGKELRCRVFGEGGNLGMTQLGRIEFSLNGGSCYTDFIDNSAGVDCSDHEVNIKILLNDIVKDEQLSMPERNKLLADMTAEVGALVLRNNYEQTLAVSVSVRRTLRDFNIYRRFIAALESAGQLDRALEFIGDDKALLDRRAGGAGLTKPEVSVLFAYTKNILKEELLLSDVPEDEFFFEQLQAEFPTPLRKKYESEMRNHSLRREIIVTQIINMVVNRTGVTFIHRLQQETGATAADVIRAYTIASNVFPIESILTRITDLDYKVDAVVQFEMLSQVSMLVRRATRWFVRNRTRFVGIQETIDSFKKPIGKLIQILEEQYIESGNEATHKIINNYVEKNISKELAEDLSLLPLLFFSLDIVDAVAIYRFQLEKFSYVYFHLGHCMELDWVREKIRHQTAENNWEELSRSLLLDDLDGQQRMLSISIMQFEPKRKVIDQQIEDWMLMNDSVIARWGLILSDLKTSDNVGLIMYSVALRELNEFIKIGAQFAAGADS